MAEASATTIGWNPPSDNPTAYISAESASPLASRTAGLIMMTPDTGSIRATTCQRCHCDGWAAIGEKA
jgi:hypothetical protein